MLRPRSSFLTILLSLLFLHSFSVVSAQRSKAPKKPVNTGAKTYSFSAAQSQLTLTLVQEGVLRKIHPTHTVGVKSFSGRIHMPADESKASAELNAESKSFVNQDKCWQVIVTRPSNFVRLRSATSKNPVTIAASPCTAI
jgi:hypothetical protein